MFQKNFVNKIKTHIFMFIFFLNLCHLLDNVEKYYTAYSPYVGVHAHCMLDN